MQGVSVLPARLDWRPLHWTLVAGVLVVNALLLWQVALWWRSGLAFSDWANIANLPANPYDVTAFRWSPPAAWIWSTLIEPMGENLWRFAHIAVLALLPWRVALIVLVSAPFWHAVAGGNMIVFAFVAGWHALNGNRAGIVAFTVMAALVPRPLMLPVLLVIVWRYPVARWSFGLAAIGVVVWSVAVGLADDFVARLLWAGGDMSSTANIGPSQFIGAAWVPIGLALGGWLLWRGHVGLASVAVSPYWFPAYLLFGLFDLCRANEAGQGDAVAARQREVRVLPDRREGRPVSVHPPAGG
jgi:hypothetical protein